MSNDLHSPTVGGVVVVINVLGKMADDRYLQELPFDSAVGKKNEDQIEIRGKRKCESDTDEWLKLCTSVYYRPTGMFREALPKTRLLSLFLGTTSFKILVKPFLVNK